MSTDTGAVSSANKGTREPGAPTNVLEDVEKAKKEIASDLARDETLAREKALQNVLYLVPINGYSSVVVFALYLISIESLISIGLSVGLTILVYNRTDDEDSSFNGLSMNWVLLSFAVITPISSAIGMAFQRREAALIHIASIRATCIELFTAHASWDWAMKPGDDVNTGRTKSSIDWLSHGDTVLRVIFGVCLDITRYLTLPNSSRARHKVTMHGRKEAEKTLAVAARLHMSIVLGMSQLSSLCEILKREGMPGNEAARIRQWELKLLEIVEKLRMLKMYRTPQALRSFSRLFSFALAPFYAPYYAQMARDLNSLGMAISFSIFTSVALTSLFESLHEMEDPFVHTSVLDGVRSKEALHDELVPQLLTLRSRFFPASPEFDNFPENTPKDTKTLAKDALGTRFFSE